MIKKITYLSIRVFQVCWYQFKKCLILNAFSCELHNIKDYHWRTFLTIYRKTWSWKGECIINSWNLLIKTRFYTRLSRGIFLSWKISPRYLWTRCFCVLFIFSIRCYFERNPCILLMKGQRNPSYCYYLWSIATCSTTRHFLSVPRNSEG